MNFRQEKTKNSVVVLKILLLLGLAFIGRGMMLVPTSTVFFLGMACPAFGIVLSNNNQRGGSFSNRVKSNLPSLNVSLYNTINNPPFPIFSSLVQKSCHQRMFSCGFHSDSDQLVLFRSASLFLIHCSERRKSATKSRCLWRWNFKIIWEKKSLRAKYVRIHIYWYQIIAPSVNINIK